MLGITHGTQSMRGHEGRAARERVAQAVQNGGFGLRVHSRQRIVKEHPPRIAREGARRMLMAALEAEVAEYVAAHSGERGENGLAMVVRKGRARVRTIVTGSGTVDVAAPRVNDRRKDSDGVRQRFTSTNSPLLERQ